jgi:hypothetical protein
MFIILEFFQGFSDLNIPNIIFVLLINDSRKDEWELLIQNIGENTINNTFIL